MENRFTIILNGVSTFLIRNYRSRLFKKSKIYKKYLEYLEKNNLKNSQLEFRVSTLEEEHQILSLFSKANGPDINQRIFDAYGLDIIDLITKENFINLKNDLFSNDIISSIENFKDLTTSYIIIDDAFYKQTYYYFVISLNYYNKNEIKIKLNKQDKEHIELFNYIEKKEILSSELNHITNKNLNLLLNKIIRNHLKTSDNIIIESIYIDEIKKDYTNILKPLDILINKFLLKAVNDFDDSYMYKKTHKNICMLLDDANHILTARELFYKYEYSIKYHRNKNLNIKILDESIKIFRIHESILDEKIRIEKSAGINKKNADIIEKNTFTKKKIEKFIKLNTIDSKHYLNILRHYNVHNSTFKHIDNENMNLYLDDIKTRIIGLALYDSVGDAKTVPERTLRENEIIKNWGYTNEDKTKLNNYLNTARRCIEYGTIMPTKS